MQRQRRGTKSAARGALAPIVLLVPVLALSCSRAEVGGEQPGPEPGQTAETPQRVEVPPTIELGPIRKGSQREHRIGFTWAFDGDSEPRKMNVGEAEARGYTVIDLGDDWVPYIFTEKTASIDDTFPNDYRQRYIDLASDRTDSDGDPLPAHRRNHLELYGIPPTLSVILAQWQRAEQEVEPCLDEAGHDAAVFAGFSGVIAYRSNGSLTKERRSARWYFAELAKTMRKLKLDPSSAADLATAAEHAKTRSLHRRWRKVQDRLDIVDHAQRRFRCERLYNSNQGRGTFKPGAFDSQTTHALAAFEKKHAIMGWGHFTKESVAALAKTPAEATHERLLRTIRERVVAAAGIVEDGSAALWKPKYRWKDKAGKKHELRDLADEYSDTVVQTLGLETLEGARKRLPWLASLGEDGFAGLLVAVKLPPLPEYYSGDMELDAVIDRGDVWYEFPYDEEGNKVHQRRRRYPHLTLYVTYLDQRIPLVHWRTTIGSWRAEYFEGQQYFKYKNSDVGPRVWKDIMAAPVWIPPPSTPTDEILKRKYINRKWQTVVNYDETGPGYRSAYGLVAAYHIKQVKNEDGSIRAEFDNQIRTHGSVDYMSILRRFSHGCHRLYNTNAVHLFGFILLHREYERLGQQEIGYRRMAEHEGEKYRIVLDTRGYKYELERPIPVMVTKGRIKGRQRVPIEEHLPMPGVEYEEPEATDATDGGLTDTSADPLSPEFPF
jgi:hypothetical protein